MIKKRLKNSSLYIGQKYLFITKSIQLILYVYLRSNTYHSRRCKFLDGYFAEMGKISVSMCSIVAVLFSLYPYILIVISFLDHDVLFTISQNAFIHSVASIFQINLLEPQKLQIAFLRSRLVVLCQYLLSLKRFFTIN